MFLSRRFLPPMSLLCAFEAAARHQSFTAAAVELHLTQSAVSRQIRALEDRLGAELFVRERQTVRLSPAGQAYAEEIRGALMRISSATVGFRANPQGGSLNLAILPTFGTRWLAPRLPQFFDQHPGITINLTTRLSQFDFQLEAVDAAIHFGPPHWPGAELALLMNETVVPACSPALLARYDFAQPRDLPSRTRPVNAGHCDLVIFERRAGGERAGEGGGLRAADRGAVAGQIDAAVTPVGVGARQPLAKNRIVVERHARELGELRLGLQPKAERDGIAGERGFFSVAIDGRHNCNLVVALCHERRLDMRPSGCITVESGVSRTIAVGRRR